nr:MAG TPA: hypothetical protein [Caudoviricetes sp.]
MVDLLTNPSRLLHTTEATEFASRFVKFPGRMCVNRQHGNVLAFLIFPSRPSGRLFDFTAGEVVTWRIESPVWAGPRNTKTLQKCR